jgi:dTDP-glucose 4,6-dehydratase
MASLLVIGGSGFFGKSILDGYYRGLLESWQIDHIYVLARKASLLKNNHPELINSEIELIDDDISSCLNIPIADYVIHAAASTDAARYILSPKSEKENILAACINFCKLAEKFLQHSKIVYVSSGAVYGQQNPILEKIPETESLNYPVDKMVESKRDYAIVKRDSEEYIKHLGEIGLSVSIARCFAFLGSYLPRDQHFAIGNFIQDGLSGIPIEVKARHKVFRSYMYADDLVIWLMTLAKKANSGCPVFNVGSDEVIEIHDLALKISQIFGVGILNSKPLDNDYVDRYIPLIDKARTMLNLDLKYNLNSALDITIKKILNS